MARNTNRRGNSNARGIPFSEVGRKMDAGINRMLGKDTGSRPTTRMSDEEKARYARMSQNEAAQGDQEKRNLRLKDASRTVAAARMENEANADTAARRSPAKATPRAPTRGTAPAKPASDMTFKQAFAAARKAGKGTFTWNGKKYTTELAKPAPKAGSTPSRGTSGGVRGRGK